MPAHKRTLELIKAVHTFIWATIESAVVWLVVSGLLGKRDRSVGIAAGIVTLESVVFLANGARCPLTGVAESLGSESGSVTDIFLPRWLAKSLPLLHVPLLMAILWLHRETISDLIGRRGDDGRPHGDQS